MHFQSDGIFLNSSFVSLRIERIPKNGKISNKFPVATILHIIHDKP